MTYIITGKCDGLTYYLKLDGEENFTWEGLINNCSQFKNNDTADSWKHYFEKKSKLPMEVVPYLKKTK